MARLPKHRLIIEPSFGKHERENGVTGSCLCGWQESASSKKELRTEYRQHLADQNTNE